MTPDPDTAVDEPDSTESESLLVYHLIGWGIAVIATVSLVYAFLVTSPPSASAYDWIEPLGQRGRIRVWSIAFGRTALRTVVGLTLFCIAVAVVLKLGIVLKRYVSSK